MSKTDRLFCCICQTQIADERIIKQGVTCSRQCSQLLRAIRRRKHDAKKCRYCNMPNTPEERKAFKLWRASLPDRPKRGRKPKPKVAEETTQQAFTEMIAV
jgi:hypothetical protein